MADGPKNVASVHRLTPTQEGILFHASAAGADAAVYVQQFSATLVTSGALDEARFERAWQAVVDRHPALRTQLNWRKREDPLQVVRASVDAPVRWLADADDFAAFVEADRAVPVDLERAPAHRVAVQRDERGARLLWTFHHALLDGWSMRLVLTDLCAAYGGAVLAPAPATHGAYVDWLLERQRAPDAALAFWRDALAGVDERCTLAWPDAGGAPATLSRALDAEATRALGEFARTRRATLSSVLRVAWAAVLARHVGTRDVVFGTTVSGRSAPVTGIETGVGMFVSTIPVRVRLGGTVERLLAAAQAHAVDAVEHEWLPLATIQSEASEVEEGDLFGALLVVENHAEDADAEDAALRLVDRRFVEQSHYGIALLAVPGERLELACVVDGSAADAHGAGRLLEDTLRLLRALPGMGPGATADDLLDAAAAESDRERAAAASLGPAARDEPAVDVLAAVESAAHAAPDAAALVSASEAITYAGLLARADAFAGWLEAEDVTAGDTVLLALPRGPEAICAMVGCLRAGVAYAPIACDAPAEQIERMRRASGAKLVVRRCAGADGASHRWSASADALAYVLFTSGTTGEPKGVEITRGALARSNRARFDHYGAGPGAFLLVSPLHFDSSVAGIWWTLAAGGTLVLPTEDEGRDPAALVALAARARATHTLLLPSLWRELMGPMRGAGVPLRTVVVAGEASGRALVEEHARTWPGVRLENEYGPTEATVWATAARLDGADGVTIGRPIGDVRACVFDEEGRWAPPGVAGELLLAGPTLARGYAGDEGLTAERFVERTWPDGARQRSYRTGDRARLTSAGAFDYLGRVDAQVKVRGQRIELLAVEAALLALPGVREAAAVLFANGARLGAAVVADTLDESAARASLRTALPSAAVPSRIVALDDFPRGRTGKVDRPRITSLLEGREEGTGSTTRALTGAEKQIAALWRGVLGVEAVGPDDDFFSLGGDSLASIRVLARAHRAGLVVEAHEFGDDPTVAGMARAAARRAGDASTPSRAAAPMSAPPTPIQRWFLDLDLPARDHWNVGVEVDGVPASATLESVAGAVSELVDVHDALRLTLDEHGALTAPKAGPPEVVEVPSGADASDAARAVNGSFRLDAPGPLLGALLLRRDGAPSRVLLVAHHLAVDALSLDSLADTLRARLDGSLDRVPVGPSFLAWASALEEIRSAAVLDAARAQWTSQLAALAPGALFHGASPGAVADEVRSDVTLDPTTSDAIVEGAHGAYRTKRGDALVLALARALAMELPHAAAVPIELESYGRAVEELPDPVRRFDAARAVGWFTTTYPVVVPGWAARSGELGGAIKATKEALRAVPDGGQSFALLGLDAPRREVLLNDLGPQASDPMQPAPEFGSLRSEAGVRAYALEVNVWIEDGLVRARFSHAPPAVDPDAGARIARAFADELRAFAEHCAVGPGGAATPSDFPLAGLDQAQLDRLADQLGEG